MWFLLTHTGRRVPIPQLPASIGSGDSADVPLRAPSVQAIHAWLLPGEETGLRLEVCDGAMVEIDGWALSQADLKVGDELLVGAVRVQVGKGQAPSAPKAARPRRRPERTLAAGRPGAAAGRGGLLHADLGQLSMGTRCILGLAILALAAAIVWAAQALVVSLA